MPVATGWALSPGTTAMRQSGEPLHTPAGRGNRLEDYQLGIDLAKDVIRIPALGAAGKTLAPCPVGCIHFRTRCTPLPMARKPAGQAFDPLYFR